MDSIWLLLLLQVVLIALNAVFACAEIAVLSINETKLARMAENGNRRAKRLSKLTAQPAKFLATIQVAITLSGFLGSAFAADNFSEPLVNWVISLGVTWSREVLDTFAVILITLILSYFTLVFGELVPKRLAMKRAEKVAMGISGLVSGVATVFRPVVWLLSVSTNCVLRLCGIDPNESEDQVCEEDIRMLVDAGNEKGTIDTQEKEFIQNIFEFNDITAKEIVIHRTDAAILWKEDTVEQWENIICKERHTLYPVCADSVDNVIGVLNAKDFFALKEKSKDNIVACAIHEAYFVPESIKADILFRNMRQTHNSMAIVLDEYGGVQGILTMQDLIEELVGDLQEDIPDPSDPEPYIEAVGEGVWHVHGNLSLELLEGTLGISVERGESDTVTGMVFHALQTVPEDGDTVLTVDFAQFTVTVERIEGHQIVQATIALRAAAVSQEKDDA